MEGAAAEVALEFHEHGWVAVAAPIAQVVVFSGADGMGGEPFSRQAANRHLVVDGRRRPQARRGPGELTAGASHRGLERLVSIIAAPTGVANRSRRELSGARNLFKRSFFSLREPVRDGGRSVRI